MRASICAHPVAWSEGSIVNFIERVSRRDCAPATVIICCSREKFSEDFQTCLEAEQSNNEQEPDSTHRLLVPTLHSISVHRSINLVFVPTLSHLRAYLSVYGKQSMSVDSVSPRHGLGNQKPILAIWGLTSLHRSTDELSAQGLSRTLASAIETAQGAHQKLVVVEPEFIIPGNGMERAGETPLDAWKEPIPLLSSSVKSNIGQRALSGRNIEVGVVVSKWCRLENADSEDSIL